MAKHLIYSMFLATALTSLPALAQTAPSRPLPAPNAAPSSTMTSPSPTPPADSTANSTSTATYYTSDHQLRASKLVGASVYDDQDKSIGSLSDVLLGDNDHQADTAIVSVGGFLGIGSKLVSVPFSQLKIQENKVIMPGATKASLESMPSYTYHDKA